MKLGTSNATVPIEIELGLVSLSAALPTAAIGPAGCPDGWGERTAFANRTETPLASNVHGCLPRPKRCAGLPTYKSDVHT